MSRRYLAPSWAAAFLVLHGAVTAAALLSDPLVGSAPGDDTATFFADVIRNKFGRGGQTYSAKDVPQ